MTVTLTPTTPMLLLNPPPIEGYTETMLGQPGHGSIVMTESTTGTAYQRLFSDGLYHSGTGQVLEYIDLFYARDGRRRDVFLVYLVPEGIDRAERKAIDATQRASR